MLGVIENPSYVQYAKNIQGSGHLLLGLISDNLDLSQIDAEELTLKEQAEDVTELVADCTRLFESRAGEAAIEPSVDLRGGPKTINVDGRRLH